MLSVVEENEGKHRIWYPVKTVVSGTLQQRKSRPRKPVTDFGIDVETITTLRITFKVSDKDLISGIDWTIGGALVLSCKVAEATEEVPDPQKFYTQHNWNKESFGA